jgi:hypothetical protein
MQQTTRFQAGNPRHTTPSVSQEEVLAAVVELVARYHSPSTSLITSRLARGGTVTASFQAGVRDALQQLRASGQLSCVTHRGIERWSVTLEDDGPAAASARAVWPPASR